MTVTKTVSTNGRFIVWSGTYAEVVAALESEQVGQSNIMGVAYQGTAGSVAVLVSKH